MAEPGGMAMDLTRFPGESVEDLTALQTFDELDRYTYYVAGCVGEFWTRMVCAHRPTMANWNVAEMSAIGVRVHVVVSMRASPRAPSPATSDPATNRVSAGPPPIVA